MTLQLLRFQHPDIELAKPADPADPAELSTQAGRVRAMAEFDDREDRREKPSAINDPRFWVSVTGVLLALALALLTIAINKLGSIDSTVQSIRDSTTRNVAEIETLKRDLARAEASNTALRQKVEKDREDQTAYNFTLAKDLKEIQVLLRLKGRSEP